MRAKIAQLVKMPRYWKSVAVFISMTGFQALASVYSIQLLSTVRAYVAGESLYSKGQMNAQFHLQDYAASHREEDYRSFVEALRVPLGDRLARESLQHSPPDRETARQGLLQGGNSPEDLDGVIRMFLLFQGIPLLAEPIKTWAEGDRLIERMSGLADGARERILKNDPLAPEVVRMRTEGRLLHIELTELESKFARQLGEASRAVQQVVLALNVLIALVLTATGITFVRRTYQAQAAVQAQIAASQAKTEFLSRMSHELRTPLNAVIGFSQLLRLDATELLSERQLDRVVHIEVAGEHLLALVNDVLDLSRIESGEMSLSLDDVSLSDVVDEAVTMVSPLVTDGGIEVFVSPSQAGEATFRRDLFSIESVQAAPTAWVKADRLRLRQVLVNLITNAVKYNRPNGKVSVTWEASEGQCVLKVVDTGEGISPERVASLFEPFNRLGAENSRVEGTGIGLVLSRQLAEMMGGTLGVESTFGHGTTATLRLEGGIASAVCRSDAMAKPDLKAGTLLRFNVLYAEDNEVNAELVRQLMTLRPSVDLRVAVNGAAALEMANLDPPDLLLVNMNLGDMTGIDLVRELRSDRTMRDVRLVALSADALPEQIEAAMKFGFSRYLTKPINFSELLEVIDLYAAAA